MIILSSNTSVKRLRKQWDLKGTRQQGHTMDSIRDAVAEARVKFPYRGAEAMCRYLFDTQKMRIPRYDILHYCN